MGCAYIEHTPFKLLIHDKGKNSTNPAYYCNILKNFDMSQWQQGTYKIIWDGGNEGRYGYSTQKS